jgi:hypothetical protein
MYSKLEVYNQSLDECFSENHTFLPYIHNTVGAAEHAKK